MKRTIVLAAALTPLFAQPAQVYDLLLKGGEVIDPASGRHGHLDIGIKSGKIVRVAAGIPPAHGRRVVDLGGYLVTPGLIDIHGHFDANGAGRGVPVDHNALRFGVTTAVDAGSATPATYAAFAKRVVRGSKTRVLAWIAPGETAARTAEALQAGRGVLVGVWAARGETARAMEAAKAAGVPVMSESADGLRAGDIWTGVYRDGAPPEERRGVMYDAGHGAEAFRFRIAVPAVRNGVWPDTISTGAERESLLLPRATMTNVLTKFLAMGMTLDQALAAATVNPAKAIRRPELGRLAEGGEADIAVFRLAPGRVALLDSDQARFTAGEELRCVLTVRAGAVVWDPEGLSLTDWKAAGPYSNFK